MSRQEFESTNFRVLAQYIGVFGTPMNSRRDAIGMTAPVMSSHATAATKCETIAMTAPVVSARRALENGGGEELKMAFILPQHYSLGSAPTPLDSRVTLREVKARVVASHCFSGNAHMSECTQRMEALRSKLQKDGWKLDNSEKEGHFELGTQFTCFTSTKVQILTQKELLARYNPPFTIPFLKTNEIHLVLDDESEAVSEAAKV
jgi:hypothetical protein